MVEDLDRSTSIVVETAKTNATLDAQALGTAETAELPLFAAAAELQRRQQQQLRTRRIYSILALLLLAAVIVYVGNGLMQKKNVSRGGDIVVHGPALIKAKDMPLSTESVQSLAMREAEFSRGSSADGNTAAELAVDFAPKTYSSLASGLTLVEGKKIRTELVSSATDKIDSVVVANDQSTERASTASERINSEDILARKEAVVIAAVVKTARPLSAAALDKQTVNKANRLLASGLNDTAIKWLVDRLAQNSRLVNSAALYAKLLISDSQFDDAANIIQKYKTGSSENLPLADSKRVGALTTALGKTELIFTKLDIRLAIAKQQYDQALLLIDNAAVPVHRDAGFLELRAAIFQAQEKYADAILAYEKLLAFNSNRSQWWMGLAVAMDASAKFSGAKQAYQNALALGGLESSLGQYANARIAQL